MRRRQRVVERKTLDCDHDLDAIRDKIPEARELGDPEDIAAWNRGEIPVLLAHPASVGYGLNLQDGGHVIVWYGLTWSLELYQQANARLHRKDTSQAALLAALKERSGK